MQRSRGFSVMAMLAGVLLTLGAGSAQADRRPHAGMMRQPDVSKTHIVFSYANDLWLVSREGGIATPLASPPGGESFPRFSPDGSTVAFLGNYEGGDDIYTISVDGGIPQRVTYHPGGEVLCDWVSDDRLLFFASNCAGVNRGAQMFTLPADGGAPEQLPVPYGTFGAISEDGKWLAYTPYTRDHRTWKRYQGGMATDIWLFNLDDHSSRKITDWAGTDSQPMWLGKRLYYISDAGPHHRLNIWMYDLRTAEHEQITHFSEYDVKWPSIGPGRGGKGEIVFQNGPDLFLLNLRTRRANPVDVIIPGDLPRIRTQPERVHGQIQAMDASSTGKRAVFEARGDIWSLPAEKGIPRNLTRTSGVAERMPSWSPDGRWIAYFADATGEYELYLTQSDGKGATHQLTEDGAAYRYNPTWSPDGKRIAFTDKAGRLFVHTIDFAALEPDEQADVDDEQEDASDEEDGESEEEGEEDSGPAPGTTILVDTDPWANAPQYSWSHDSAWLAYAKGGDNLQNAIYLYDLHTGEKHQVTSGMFSDTWPAFDQKGEYLYFASHRHFQNPIYEDVGTTFVYANTDVLVAVPLREDVKSPWLPKVDEEKFETKEEKQEKDDKEKDGAEEDAEADDAKPEDNDNGDADEPAEDDGDDDTPDEEDNGDNDASADEPAADDEEQPADKRGKRGKAKGKQEQKDADKQSDDADDEKQEEKPKYLQIDLDGFERRAMQIPVSPGGFHGLSATHDSKLIYVRQPARGGGGGIGIKMVDIRDDNPKEKTVLNGVGSYAITADRKKLLVRRGNSFAYIKAAPNQKMNKQVPLSGMIAMINPRAEWRQVFHEAWRLYRDFFYVENMHGVDWEGVRDHYEEMLDDCVSRADVSHVIREMIAELNIGHAYYWGGEPGEGEPHLPTGLLGADFALENGAYRIKHIITGGPWDLNARGPLSQPGVEAEEGEYLLAVNGIPVDTSKDLWAAFLGISPGRVVTLTLSEKPELDDDAREVNVKLISSGREAGMRYRAWVEQNRAHVDEQSDGRVGYIHVPDTGVNGQNELFRQFYGQRHKAALIIDERWNGGGQIPTRFIELLNRPRTNYWARRDGKAWPWPEDSHQGPKCMLINGLAGSGGDAFPYYFRQFDLGPLIGMRTWGGLVGISGNPRLIDGGYVTVPTFGFYELDGTWGIEGHGVDPDIEVVDDPALMVDGGDPQLDKAIEVMLEAIERHPYVPVPQPEPPDRSGMGIPKHER